MKVMKKDYASYSIKELEQLFEKQKEKIRELKRQKEEMNQNAHKIFKDVHLLKPTPEDLKLNKQYHQKLQTLNDGIDDGRQELNQITIELSKKLKRDSKTE